MIAALNRRRNGGRPDSIPQIFQNKNGLTLGLSLSQPRLVTCFSRSSTYEGPSDCAFHETVLGTG